MDILGSSSTRAFLENDANSTILLGRAVPQSLLPALREAEFLDMGKKEFDGVPFNAGFLIFKDPQVAQRFANHFNDGTTNPEVLTPGQEGSKRLYKPVKRDLRLTHSERIGPTESVSYDTTTGQVGHSVSGGERVERSESTTSFYSVGIKGRNFTPEMIAEAFGCRIHTSPASLQANLVGRAIEMQTGQFRN